MLRYKVEDKCMGHGPGLGSRLRLYVCHDMNNFPHYLSFAAHNPLNDYTKCKGISLELVGGGIHFRGSGGAGESKISFIKTKQKIITCETHVYSKRNPFYVQVTWYN